MGLVSGPGIAPDFYLTFIFVRGLLGTDGYGAADGITPVKRALGSLQHFDLFDIKQLLVELGRVAHEHTVKQHRHG